MERIKMLSLFSGIGAPETALKNLGYEIDLINYCEIDKFASTSYQAIHNVEEDKNLKDVKLVNGSLLPQADLLFHGSPCTSFSMVGKQDGAEKGSETASSLMWETVRIVKENKPKIVIWENVKAVLNKKHKPVFDEYIEELNHLGYSSSWKVINPRDLGEAQNRPRIFVVSILGDEEFVFPELKALSQKTLKDYLEKNVHEKYQLDGDKAYNFAYGNEHWLNRMYILHPEDKAFCLVAKSGKACRTNNFILVDKNDYPSTSYNRNDVKYFTDNNLKIRALTPLEYWRLQGFSDKQFHITQKALADKYKKGDLTQTDAQLYKQAGNSINVKVLENFLGDVIENHIK